ncbi:hypothetical protein Bca101_035189 [Brassica carinata]
MIARGPITIGPCSSIDGSHQPPRNFLTTVDVWVQIYNIPVNYYEIDTMDYLASKIGHVLEIAYDPKASQKMAYIRAHIRLSLSRPALANRLLNLPSGGSVLIEFEYEKLRKRCFHCYQLTHERPFCPILNRKSGNGVKPESSAKPGDRIFTHYGLSVIFHRIGSLLDFSVCGEHPSPYATLLH